jgi:hypothetical protein
VDGELGIWIFRGGNRRDRDGLGWSEVGKTQKTQKRCLSLPMDHQVSLGSFSFLCFCRICRTTDTTKPKRNRSGQVRSGLALPSYSHIHIFTCSLFTFPFPFSFPFRPRTSRAHSILIKYRIILFSYIVTSSTSPSKCGILYGEYLALVQSRPSP